MAGLVYFEAKIEAGHGFWFEVWLRSLCETESATIVFRGSASVFHYGVAYTAISS